LEVFFGLVILSVLGIIFVIIILKKEGLTKQKVEKINADDISSEGLISRVGIDKPGPPHIISPTDSILLEEAPPEPKKTSN